MIDQELTNYIIAAQKHGLSDFEIKQNLLAAGWEAAAVEENFVHAKTLEAQAQTAPSQQAQISQSAAVPSVFSSSVQQTVGPAYSQASSSAQPFQKAANGKPFYKRPAPWIIAAAVLIIAGGAYGYYAYAYTTPARVLQNFTAKAAEQPKTFQNSYILSYSDNSLQGENLSFSVNGNVSSDSSDKSNLKFSNDSQVAVGAYGFSYNIPVDELLIGQVLYLDLGKIDQLKPFLTGQNIEWVKLDLPQLQQYLDKQTAGPTPDSITNNAQLMGQLKQIWSAQLGLSGGFITPGSFLARESINGTPVYHIKPQINKPALASALQGTIQAIGSAESTTTPFNFTDDDKAAITALVNKFQISSFDMWIGQKDSLLYKINLVTSVPSLSDFSSSSAISNVGPLNQLQSKSRDSKRLNDVRQVASALDLYFNDFGGYPSALNGQPQNLENGYLTGFPVAPEPADGTCTDYYNGYWYKVSGQPKTVKGQTVYPSYSMTFCLGADTGGYKAGIGMVSPSGIQSDIACPSSTQDNCVNGSTSSSQGQGLTSAINQMSFGGRLSLSITYSGYGKPVNLQAPASSTDLMSLIMGNLSSFGGGTSTTPDLSSNPATPPANTFQESGESMAPTLHKGDYIKIIPGNTGLKSGDIIVFKYPKDQTQFFVDRIVGLPKDQVEIKEGSVFINGAKLDESQYLPATVAAYGAPGIVTLTSSQYFVLGDNRTAASDSRVWGPLDADLIIGKMIATSTQP